MGTTISSWIEYDEHGQPPFSQEPEVLPLDAWVGLSHAKDYSAFGALSGVRNSTGIDPLFPRRGLPTNPSFPVKQEISEDDNMVGWLHPSEVTEALAHHSVPESELSLEMRCVLHMLDFLATSIGNQRVRWVFEIE